MEWDNYFMELCEVVASNSKCQSRKLGAIITGDKVVVATGYNGPPREFPNPGHCPRKEFNSGERLDLCPATHAEVNCVASAARLGVSVKGATLYLNWTIPCKNCLGVIINAGIEEIVVKKLEFYDQLAEEIVKHSSLIIREAKI